MKAILMQQGLWEIVNGGGSEEKKPEVDDREKARLQDIQYKAYSTLILNLTDRVLREVSKEDTTAGVWLKLESLYMTKSLANRLHLKQKLLTFKIADGRSILEQLEEFGKCIDDLENIDEEIKDEDKALMLLNSLPKSYEHFKDAMLLGRESKISYEEVHSALKLRDLLQNQLINQLKVYILRTIIRKARKRNSKRSKKMRKVREERKQEAAIIVRSRTISRNPVLLGKESKNKRRVEGQIQQISNRRYRNLRL